MNPSLPETLETGDEAEAGRLARGWRRTLEVLERIKRRDEGRPLVEIVKD